MIVTKIKRLINNTGAEWGRWRRDFLFSHPLCRTHWVPGRRGFLRDVFLPCFYPSLGVRKQTFKVLFENLQASEREPVFIVETGTSRFGLKNPAGDGCSTYQFDAFARYSGGKVLSLDIDENAVAAARRIVSAKTTVICQDSLAALADISEKIDCLYLDSFDVDCANPGPAAEHAMKEFLAAEHSLGPGSLVMVDDTPASPEFIPEWWPRSGCVWPNGKGMLLVPYLEKHSNFVKITHEYQCIFQKKEAVRSVGSV